MPTAIDAKKRHPSSFVPQTSPEEQQRLDAKDAAKYSWEAPEERPQTYAVPMLAVTIPEKYVIPEDMVKQLNGIAFRAIASEKTLVKIVYQTEWENAGKEGGARSGVREPGFVGYRGREVYLTVVFDDADGGTLYSATTADAIDTLRTYATMETHQAMTPRMKQKMVLKFKKGIDPVMQKHYARAAWKAARGLNYSPHLNSLDDYEYRYRNITAVEYQNTGETPEPELTDLNTPKPPLPLTFKYGSIQVTPCVITKLDITAHRYSSQGIITSATVRITLHEITAPALWAVTESNMKKYIADVEIVDGNPKPRPKIVPRDRYSRIDDRIGELPWDLGHGI